MRIVWKYLIAGVGLVGILGSAAMADPGLLLVAHGSPSTAWNGPVQQLGNALKKELVGEGKFADMKTSFLEFAEPDVPAQIEALEKAGCDRIVAVPIFIAPSGHSHFDVPAVLGVYDSASIRKIIAEEGGRVAKPNVPVMLTSTLQEGDCLDTYALDEVKSLSTSPKEEAVVFLLHGDAGHDGLIESMMRRIATHCCGNTGIGYADWATIEVGQTYRQHGIPAILQALEHKKRVIVVGLYVSLSAEKLHQMVLKRGMRDPMGRPQTDPLEGKDVVFSKNPLIAHPATSRWVKDVALAAIAEGAEEAGQAAGNEN